MHWIVIQFVEEETTLMNDPLFSREALHEYTKGPEKQNQRRLRQMKSCFVKADKKKDACESSELKSSLKCQFCDGNHDLDDCQFYNELSVEDRSSFLKKNKLCYGCYREITSTHTARTCNNRRICKVCQGKVPSGLHGYKMKRNKTLDNDIDKMREKTESINSNCTGFKNAGTVVVEVISICVVKVRLRHCNSKKEVKTFSLRDSCSQGTFLTELILKKLDATAVGILININTLNNNQKVSSTLVDRIMVSKQVLSTRNQIHWVKLPKLYTRKDIPVDPSKVANSLKLKKWRYLDCIAGKIVSDDAVSIDVLIGANCTKAFEPIDFIASKNGGLYALETVLGWCVVGPIVRICKRDDVIICNRIAVEGAGTKQISRHQFEFQKEVKDTGITDMVLRMY